VLSKEMVRRRKSLKKNKNYFMKFFDGELSLPHSYWLVGVLYSIGVAILITMFSIMMSLPLKTDSVLLLPWVIFTSIGIWRSSDNYKGLKFWAILAKIAVVIGIIQAVGYVLMGV
tara:strand:- start:42 stop:386 length:345 start_codon:yes stop_codon:yes gene_type:complete